MSEVTLDQPLSSITVGDLKELMQDWMREAIAKRRGDYFLDDDGYLVFTTEEAYAAYLDRHEAKLPSEVRAYFIDDQGYKTRYSDWEPTPEYADELDTAEKEIAAGKVHDFGHIVAELGLDSA